MKQFGIPQINFAPDGPAGGAAVTPPGGTPPGGAPPAAFTPPWGSDVNQMWMIEGKPWFDVAIPEGPAREHAREKQYKNPVVVTDSLYNANKMMRMDTRLAVPDFETAKPEDIAAYYDKRGRPANPDAYDIKAPDGVKFDDTVLKFGKTIAHELGLNPKEAQTMVSKYTEFEQRISAEKATQEKAANDAALTALETAYGADLAPNKEAGLRVVQALKLPETVMQGVEKAIGNAALIDLLVRIGKASSESGGFKGGDGGTNGEVNTPQAAQAKIDQLMADPAFNAKYTNKNNPGHAAALKEMEQLYARASAKA